MASLEATAEYRGTNPAASTAEQVASDVPQLRDISKELPEMLIYTTSADSYEQVRAFFNASVTQQPLAVIRPRTDTEVAATVRELHARGIPFGIRSGGHDMDAAQAQGRDGVLIDLRGLDSIVVAEDKRSVRVGGGTLGIKLSQFLHQHKLITPHGWCQTVSIAGWALGGGYGYASAFYGLGADQMLGGRVVLANGDIVDTDEHPDLLWALRGAGNGSFGIVVELRLKVYPETGFLGGFLAFPNAQVESVLAGFAEFEQELPINFTGEASHMALPGVGPVFAWLFAWTSQDDELGEGWAFLEKMKALGTPIMNTVAAAAGVPDATAQASDFEEYKKWTDNLVEDIANQGHSLPWGNRNLAPEKDMDWVATYGDETVARLKEIKRKFDPDNVFRTGYPRLDLL
ncbi:6-hydroxy-D-nicotine oxidase 4 [Colletotrichum chlorophyti]|uniref:6-hydroxy-D-nicotine oxidase 4 n=1 Tax=Colletotrichum chlorophyti TaxID=708187 RepID=A0A1Q8RAF8_9PEZI|nr:6-hydroxy-D-nicotine oxidase 4 [Colletotrichum chlorophyti]